MRTCYTTLPMDPMSEIKARLPIEELVRQYAQLTKKGRNFVALCPFHHDTHPSLLVSPDKGIAYCFPCQKGGDIFSFYQLVENVDFPQALKELAEKTGVRLASHVHAPKQDEKERLRSCLETAASFYRRCLEGAPGAQTYLTQRGVTPEEVARFGIGYAPEGGSVLYDHLLKAGFSRTEIVTAGLGVRRDLRDERVLDRFRGRIMFPIRDVQERLIGFGGRTIIGEDAKYMNTSDGPLYRKSSVLYGLPLAREAMRDSRSVIVVEGYFDVLACHRVGVHHVVATCGTALTEEHARLLKRYADRVILCLDSDRAGRIAAERAFTVLSKEDVLVHLITLPDKDPADGAQEDPVLLRQLLGDEGVSYIDAILEGIRCVDPRSSDGKRDALERLLVIYDALPLSAQRLAFLQQASAVMGMAESQLESDLRQRAARPAEAPASPSSLQPGSPFSAVEITLGLFLLYPQHRGLLQELIAPEGEIASALYEVLKVLPDGCTDIPGDTGLPQGVCERATILQLYCEEHGFSEWADTLAAREIRRNCLNANRETLKRKQAEVTRCLLQARAEGKTADEELLRTQYQQLLKLAKMAM